MSDIPFDSTGEPAASNINFDKVSVKQPLPIVPQNFPPIIPPFIGGVVQSSGAPFSFPLQASLGGTGFGSFAIGDILYADSTSTLARLPVSTNGFVLTLDAGLPKWAAISAIGVIGGSGTAGKIPKFATAFTIGDSILSEAGGLITVTGNLAATGLTASNYVRTDASKVLVSVSAIPSTDVSNSSFVTSVAGTAGRITSSGGLTPTLNIDTGYVGQSSITTVGSLISGSIVSGFGAIDIGGNSVTAGSLISPFVTGGTSTTQDLTFKTTTGVGATGADMHFLVGNNGATEAMTILNSGNVGIRKVSPAFELDIVGKIGLSGTQVAYLPDQATFLSSLVLGDGGTMLSRTGTPPVDPQDFEADGSYNGLYNTFVGIQAGINTNTGNLNVFVGDRAGRLNTNGDQNVFIGSQSGEQNTSGYHNTFVGAYSGPLNTTGFYNTFIGTDAGSTNSTGNNNTFVGTSAGNKNTGNQNSFFGAGAGTLNTIGSSNTAIGYNALPISTIGNDNASFGAFSLASNVSGINNLAIGTNALFSNTIGHGNTGVGTNALRSSVDTDGLTGIGYLALYNTTGAQSTGIGYGVLYDVTSGTGNTALGYNTGRGITTGSSNTIIGANVGGLSATLANNIIIADGDGNQRLRIDGNANFGINGISFADGVKVVFIANATTVPTTNPTGGALMFIDSGTPKFMTPTGNVFSLIKSSAYTPTNVITDRSFDANATTLDEVADVLGTLIADLQATGLIG